LSIHFHRNTEELFVVLSGKATLRKFNNEFVEIAEHAMVFFEAGPEGVHQLYNHTDLPIISIAIAMRPAAKIRCRGVFNQWPEYAILSLFQNPINF